MNSRQSSRHRSVPLADQVRRLLGMLTITAIALAAIFGGHRYLYCRVMDEVMTAACCPQGDRDDDGRVSVGALDDCLEVRVLGRLMTFIVGPDFAIPPAALIAILPASVPVPEPEASPFAGDRHPIRAGPYSPAAFRSRLMVFLT